MRRFFPAVLAFIIVLSMTTVAAEFSSSKAAKAGLKSVYPGVSFYDESGEVRRIYGAPFGVGSNPINSAELFKSEYAQIFDVDAEDLIPGFVKDISTRTQQLMYDRETGNYKFTLVYYSQTRNGIPVFEADLRLLVRNSDGYPLVLAASSLRKIGDYQTDPMALSIDPMQTRNTFESNNPQYKIFSEPRKVIWAGVEDMQAAPTVGVEFVAADAEIATDKYLFILDPLSGEVLYSRNMIIDVDVTGQVQGNATSDHLADFCGPEVPTPLPYARVYINPNSPAYADQNGDFTIPNSGSSPVTVYSHIRGQWFAVTNNAGNEAQLSQSVTPPGPANFLHNSSNSSEFNRAEVNGYLQANVVRDFTLVYNPSYPVIYNQQGFPVYVNRTDGYCPGNAWYDGSSINFCQSGGTYPNTAYGGIVHHEYGHHLVEVAGSGQDSYGEGMGDVMGLLILDISGAAFGFYGNCNEPLRDANNTIQYPCSGEIHYCGQLISGCVWSTRNELAITNPSNYIDILANLSINSMLLHTGGGIAPDITIDYLTLDDNDGDIGNGTPHFDEITTGFGAHNMWAGPPPANDNCSGALDVCTGVYTGNTSNTTNDGSSSCGSSSGSPDLWYRYTPAANGTLTVSGCSGTTYDMVLSLHSGCPGNSGNELDCDDDGCGTTGGPSIVSTAVTAGNSYYIRVTGWNGSAGPYSIDITGPDCQPVVTGTLNGTVTDGTNPISGVTVTADDGLGHQGSTSTLGDGTYTMDLAVGTYEVTYSHSGYQTQMIPGIVITENTTTTQDVVMTLIPQPDISVNPPSLNGSSAPGGAYNTNVTVSNLGPGSLTFTVTPTEYGFAPIPLDSQDNYDPDKKPYEGEPNKPDPNVILQGGDNIATATVISVLPYSDAGTTSGYIDDYDEVCYYPGSTSPDVVYRYTPSASRTLDISLCNGSDYDTKVYVYENSTSTLVACNDDNCTSPNYPYPYVSSLTGVPVTAGNDYYIVVDGFGGDFGNYVLDVSSPTTPWLTVAPLGGTIPSGGADIQLTVEMNALDLTVGTYTGNVNISSNDPDQPSIDIPVTFNVTGGGGSGTLQGTVTDNLSSPITGVDVFADDGLGNTGSTTTNGSGFYTLTLVPGTYTVTFSHPSYQDVNIPGVTVTDGGTTTQDAVMDPIPQNVPTLSEWGMLFMMLLLLASGTIALIRKRKRSEVEA